MTFTTPTTRSTGDLITAAIWNSNVVQNIIYLYNLLTAFLTANTLTQVTVTAGDASVDIQNIPQTGKDLRISGKLLPTQDDVGLWLRLNNRSGGTDYSWSCAVFDAGTSLNDSKLVLVTGTTATSGIGNLAAEGCSFEIIIPNYSSIVGSMYPMIMASVILANANVGQAQTTQTGGFLKFAEAINRITLLFEANTIAAGTVQVETIG